MEKFMQREKVMVEYGLSGDSPKSSHRRSSEDLDFNDVFGGPPRRFSMQEVRVRYSFGESEEEEGASSSSPKPVFGEESAARRRRRRQGDDFFDDIFRGDESCGSPRRAGNLIGSNPGSRIMSPVRTLPPKTDPFATSLPVRFSLPAKLTKAVEPHTFAARNHNRNKMDGSASGSNSPPSSSSLSRFSNLGIRGYDGIRNDVYPIHHQCLLPHEASFTSEDSPFAITSDQKENIENMKNDTINVDGFGNEFHFSIYKWAGGGVQMLMPLDGGNNLKSKDISIKDMCASSNEEIDHMEPESFTMEEIKKLQNSLQETLHDIPESKTRSSSKDRVVFGGTKENTKDDQVKSLDEIPGNITEMNENKTRFPKEAHESKNTKKNVGTAIDLKIATVDKSSLPGAAINSRMASGKSRVARKVRDFVQIFNQDAYSRPKADVQTRSQSFRWKDVGVKQDENEVSLNAAKVKEKVNLQNAAKNPDFPLKDADSRPKADVQTRSQSFRWKDVGIKQDENEVSLNAAKVKEKVNLQNADKNPDFSLKVDENINKDEAQHSRTSRRSYHFSANQKNAFLSESIHKDSKISVEILDDFLEDNFLVQEIFDDHEKETQNEVSEDIKALDTKIQQWSVGKEGNIRSLLSTLQYVLWAGSGWKPVALVDLIEANSVKRAYQKALLRLHPDKLQQKDAAVHHKYIAEKVFDILQEAWDHFNTLDPL